MRETVRYKRTNNGQVFQLFFYRKCFERRTIIKCITIEVDHDGAPFLIQLLTTYFTGGKKKRPTDCRPGLQIIVVFNAVLLRESNSPRKDSLLHLSLPLSKLLIIML